VVVYIGYAGRYVAELLEDARVEMWFCRVGGWVSLAWGR
jgi:hypothetical protein